MIKKDGQHQSYRQVLQGCIFCRSNRKRVFTKVAGEGTSDAKVKLSGTQGTVKQKIVLRTLSRSWIYLSRLSKFGEANRMEERFHRHFS